MNKKVGFTLFLVLCSMAFLSSCGETGDIPVDSPPPENIEEEVPEENTEEVEALVAEDPPTKQGTDWSS